MEAPAADDRVSDGSPPAWVMPRPPRQLAGFAYGFSYPSLSLAVGLPAVDVAERARLAGMLRQLAPARLAGWLDDARLNSTIPEQVGNRPRLATAHWFAALADAFAAAADLPIVQRARVLRVAPGAGTLAVPMVQRGLGPLSGLLQVTCGIFRGEATDAAAVSAQVASLFDKLVGANLTTSNTPRLVKAAVENGIAWQEVAGTPVIQYGIGRKAVLLDSTFTQFTPNIAARLARHKHEAAAMLRRARLPVPDHALVHEEAEAIAAAQRLGYPVVVKPADCDGGVAVRADLRNEDELREAFAVARKVSRRILVEQFVRGRDFRLTVFRGRCIWAVERQPAGVTGNGTDTIAALVDQANQDPRRGDDAHAPLKRLKLDDEALGLLARDGLDPGSVPDTGTFIRLRRASNVSSGGMPVAVFERIHPDNARLAVRAAAALKLDLAGVDLLIPDIAVSWKAGGAAICEVNAQPELGGVTAHHLYPLVLKDLTGGDGHVPTVAVIGRERAEQLGAQIAAAFRAAGMVTGLHVRGGILVGDALLEPGPVPQIAAGRMLAGNTNVDALVFAATNAGVLQHGFPVPRIDLLILTPEDIEPPLGTHWTSAPPGIRSEILQALGTQSRSILAMNPGDAQGGPWNQALQMLGMAFEQVDQAEVISRVQALLRPARSSSEQGEQ